MPQAMDLGLEKIADQLPNYGETIIYNWDCRREGAFLITDTGNIRGDETGAQSNGLFAALIVEPPNSVWTDPTDIDRTMGQPKQGTAVDVHPLGTKVFQMLDGDKTPWLFPSRKYSGPTKSFREFVIIFHDEMARRHHPFRTRLPNPCATFAPPCFAQMKPDLVNINYRGEPMSDRIQILLRRLADPNFQFSNNVGRGVYNEEIHHSSWTFGDPSTPIFKGYVGDPTRIHLIHAGVKEAHVFHLHHYQWHTQIKNPRSPIIDALSVSPSTVHSFDLLYGIGTRVGSIGDTIWHCHLYPHFESGMWGMLRAFDTYHFGQDTYPDGTPIKPLAALPDRQHPPLPTPSHPGFPNFIPGIVGQKSPPLPYWQPGPVPDGLDYREATQLELNAMNDFPQPGAVFQKFPLGTGDEKVINVDISVVELPHIYNKEGWINKHQILYILDSQLTNLNTGPSVREPITLHVPVNAILELKLTNRLPTSHPGNEFDLPLPMCPSPIRGFNHYSGEVGTHVHLVKFDFISSDGACVGWNYMSGISLGKSGVFRWWVDEEFTGIFFHDHLFATDRQKKGLFGMVGVHPEESLVRDPWTHEIQPYPAFGLQKVIETASGFRYRDVTLAVADFQPAWNSLNQALNPPNCPSGNDPGIMTLNYRSAPIIERALRGGDPKDWFNSFVHGDPSTVIFETYPGDPLRIRFYQGAQEEPHSLQINGLRWKEFYSEPKSIYTNSQAIGISEVFRLDIDQNYGPGDFMYKLVYIDDWWLGCWGIIRSLAAPTNLLPLSPKIPTIPVLPCDPTNTRRYWVDAISLDLTYFDNGNIKYSDPFSRIYEVTAYQTPGGPTVDVPLTPFANKEPLIIRARKGECVEIILANNLKPVSAPEPFFPQVPLDILRNFEILTRKPLDAAGNLEILAPSSGISFFTGNRPVSNHVSIHADIVSYDVRLSDGYNVGRNGDQTVAPGSRKSYMFYIDPYLDARSVLLQDGADIRYNKHHGLIGALIIEPPLSQASAWVGSASTITYNTPISVYNTELKIFQSFLSLPEIVLLSQDGLRNYVNGNLNSPVIDFIANEIPVFEVQSVGQRGFNYRSHPLSLTFNQINPLTPIFVVKSGFPVNFHILGAGEKARPQGFTVHGNSWLPDAYIRNTVFSATPGIYGGMTFLMQLTPVKPGTWVYRSTNYASALQQGLWGWLVSQP